MLRNCNQVIHYIISLNVEEWLFSMLFSGRLTCFPIFPHGISDISSVDCESDEKGNTSKKPKDQVSNLNKQYTQEKGEKKELYTRKTIIFARTVLRVKLWPKGLASRCKSQNQNLRTDFRWVAKRWKTCVVFRANLSSTKVNPSQRKWVNKRNASRKPVFTCVGVRVRLARDALKQSVCVPGQHCNIYQLL